MGKEKEENMWLSLIIRWMDGSGKKTGVQKTPKRRKEIEIEEFGFFVFSTLNVNGRDHATSLITSHPKQNCFEYFPSKIKTQHKSTFSMTVCRLFR
jgi:hypothetical protein